MTAQKPADWKNDDAVLDYIKGILDAVVRDSSEDPELFRLHPKSVWAERKLKVHKLEDEAVEFAEAGNYKLLAALLRKNHPANDESLDVAPWDRDDFHGAMLPSGPVGTIRSNLSPSTYELIADILDGTHRKPKHRPPASPDERRAMTRAHDAADWVPVIKAILQKAYPNQANSQIYDRAVWASARLNGIRPQRLQGLLGRPKSDRRRLQDP
ncbi:hypothetical protein QA639_40285 [Bradyrhizobium pachyrhizi]|uniref:hypothetical protein n=1 Tax=Bradyrhizobium pachyrhizi TaxID=280333 RepID=UPI0024B1F254|nr:hypothetical protein [Bradyrhizobium pachyrhizi]WFU55710.1 hypothetical protein QA639_40285 [Bradyrhizobium pachyrhizi]